MQEENAEAELLGSMLLHSVEFDYLFGYRTRNIFSEPREAQSEHLVWDQS